MKFIISTFTFSVLLSGCLLSPENQGIVPKNPYEKELGTVYLSKDLQLINGKREFCRKKLGLENPIRVGENKGLDKCTSKELGITESTYFSDMHTFEERYINAIKLCSKELKIKVNLSGKGVRSAAERELVDKVSSCASTKFSVRVRDQRKTVQPRVQTNLDCTTIDLGGVMRTTCS